MRTPDAAAFARYYPAEARKKRIEGRASLRCKLSAAGGLTACQVVDETPPGEGFGPAAMRLARFYRMQLREDGGDIGGVVQVPISFRLGG